MRPDAFAPGPHMNSQTGVSPSVWHADQTARPRPSEPLYPSPFAFWIDAT